MKKIVIIGNSWAGVKVVEDLRKSDPSWEATVFALEGQLPYNRAIFPSIMGHKGEITDAFVKPQSYFDKSNVKLSDEKLARVNFKKNTVFTEDKKAYEYDVLLVVGTENSRLPEIKGTNKAGVTGAGKLKDVQQILNIAPLAETVVIQGQDLNGVKFAAALRKRNLETIFISTGSKISPLDEESSRKVLQSLQDSGIRVVTDTTIAEILGDVEVKAIRLKTGKVIGCQLVILTDELPDLKFFKDTGLEFQDSVKIDAHFRTNIANVYALADVAESDIPAWTSFDNYLAVLEHQASLVAASITNQTSASTAPAGEIAVEINGVPLLLVPSAGDGKQFELVNSEQSVDQPSFSRSTEDSHRPL